MDRGYLTHVCSNPLSGPRLNRGQIPIGLNGTMAERNSGLERVLDVWSPALHPSALPRSTLVSQTPSGRVDTKPCPGPHSFLPHLSSLRVQSENIPTRWASGYSGFKRGKLCNPLIYQPALGVTNTQSPLPEHPQALSYTGPSVLCVDL